MSSKQDILEIAGSADELEPRFARYVARIKALGPDFVPPKWDVKRHRRLAVSELKPVFYAIGWNGKRFAMTMAHGSKLLERAVLRVHEEPSANTRRRLTAGLVKAGLMSPAEAGALDRQTLTPDRRALDARKLELRKVLERVADCQAQKREIERRHQLVDAELKAHADDAKALAREVAGLEKATP